MGKTNDFDKKGVDTNTIVLCKRYGLRYLLIRPFA